MQALRLQGPPAGAGARGRQALHATAVWALPPHRQDRISSSGEWVPASPGSGATTQQQPGEQQRSPQQPYVIGSTIDPTATAPAVPPVSSAAIDRLAELLQSARGGLVLTGAGCSTESGVPDYRGPGGAYVTSPQFKPMSHQQFMASDENRARYWARSFAGWHKFSGVQPNAAHESIARLQHSGWARALITQNVDRLHHRAGSRDVLELHGTTHEVICMGCGRISCRHELQERLAALNPEAAAAEAALAAQQNEADDRLRLLRAGSNAAVHPSLRETGGSSSGSGRSLIQRPDGDAEVADAGRGFRVPPCSQCVGFLKPRVVFFGDGIPPQVAQASLDLAASCRALVVVGSSLAVWSAYRLARTAVDSGAQLAIITTGPTRADDLARLKIEGRAGEVLARLAAHPSLQVPPVY